MGRKINGVYYDKTKLELYELWSKFLQSEAGQALRKAAEDKRKRRRKNG